MAIDYSQRPSGMSKREYAASILGGSKEDYDSSGNKKSASSSSSKSSKSSSTYKPTEYKYQNFVDTKGVSESFDKARSVYTDQLTALKPRYEELYKQLQESEAITAEKEQQQFGQEQTQQKVNLAKRGVATDTSNQFYTTEAGKLEKQQGLQSRERALEFAGKRLDVSQAQSADERDLNTAIANVDLGKATTIESMISSAKQFVAGLNQTEKGREYQSKRDAVADAQWERTFAFTKSKDAADRSLELYKLAKSEATSKDNAYNSALSTLVATAYSSDNPAPYTRERIAKQLKAAFPNLSSKVDQDINKFFPTGWESQASGTGARVSTGDDGETYIEY